MITKQKWKEKYSKFIWPQIDRKAYKKSIKQLKQNIFTPDRVNKKRSIIIDSYRKEAFVFAETEQQILEIIRTQLNKVITIPKKHERMFMRAGVVIVNSDMVNEVANYCSEFKRNKYIKNHKNKNVYVLPLYHFFKEYLSNKSHFYFITGNDTIRQLNSRLERVNSLQKKIKISSDYSEVVELTFEVNKIKERIKADKEKQMTYGKAMELVEKHNKKIKNFNYEIELTYDIRKIASQSTETPWRSCMNLDNGENVHYVATGISAGVFVAYMRDKNKEYARILCKPYVAYLAGKGFVYKWMPSKLYWASEKLPASMKSIIQEKFTFKLNNYLESIHKPMVEIPNGKPFVLASKVYNDREPFAIYKNGQQIEDDKEVYDESDNIDVEDFYNFDGAIKFDTHTILCYIRDSLASINQQRIPHTSFVVTDENLKKLIDSLGNSGLAYQEAFELIFGVVLTAHNIFELENFRRWHTKLNDIYYALRGGNFTQRYSKLIAWRKENIERIILKYDLNKEEFLSLLNNTFNELSSIQIVIYNKFLAQNEDRIHLDEVNTLEKILVLKKNSPEKYKKIRSYINNHYFDGISFEQNWD